MMSFLYKIWYWVKLILIIGLIVLLSISIRVYRTYDAGNKDAIMNRNDTGLMLYDRTGKLFFAFNRARPRVFVPLSEIPLFTQQAIISAEDKNFYSHIGFSISGILRSLYLDIKEGSLTYGGSTITQQLIKNSLLTTDKKLWRKFQEIVVAVKAEQHFSKKEILEMYLNSAYFGKGVFGVEAASRTYFNKSAHDLTIGESAILASLLPSPTNLSPLASDKSEVKQRRAIVLHEMQKQKYITPAQLQVALNEPITLVQQEDTVNERAPHFALMVKQELDRIYGEEAVIRAGMKVTTTLDPTWQSYAEQAVRTHVESMKYSSVGNGAAVAIDPSTGEIRALVGSIDWFQQQYGKTNMAISPRQTGSAFKPIVYATGIEHGVITAATTLHDVPTTFPGGYTPKDYDNRYRGNVLVRRALSNSLNIPAVETIQKTGIPRVVALARKLGISTIRDEANFNLSTALGAESISLLELTNAYATLANSGTYQEPMTMLHIENKYGTEIQLPKKETHPAVSSATAYIISSILSDNRARAEIFGNSLTISRPAAVKTGTTQDYRDGWTVGYTPNLAVGVWIGNNNNTPMQRTPASIGAAPLWRALMERYTENLPQQAFIPPAGISTRFVCASGGLAYSNFGTLEYFIPNTEPTAYCAPVIPTISPSANTASLPLGNKPPQELRSIQ